VPPEESGGQAGPLAGVRVLDLTRYFPGSYCTLALAQLGADVIKIEHPLGDHIRNRGSDAPANVGLQRGKRSVALDLKAPQAAGVLRRLAEGADVLVESAQPGAMERLGLGYQAMSQVNPRLVWCSITTFGDTGEYAGRGAHDLQVLGLTGLLHAIGGSPPTRPRAAVATPATGLMAATGILAALRECDRTGTGSQVHVTLLATTMWLMSDLVPGTAAGDPLHAKTAANDVYECADGLFLSVSAIGPQAWKSLVDVTGCPLDRESAPRTADDVGRAASELAAGFLRRTRAQWLALLHEAGVPAAPVLGLTEAVADSGIRASGVILEADGPPVVAAPVRIRTAGQGAPAAALPGAPPGVGQHTREVLREAGLAESDIDQLAAAGAI
jgi:alpha-methylacyl-CoA racemase